VLLAELGDVLVERVGVARRGCDGGVRDDEGRIRLPDGGELEGLVAWGAQGRISDIG
jgi:hypothetical protein